MKRLAYIVLSLLVLVSCTSRQEYAAMRQGLDSINELNRNDEPFTVSDVQPYVEYFNHHGEPNDRMLSHYLLGRAYHEQGEAPMALDYYQKAIECADTTSNNCDFKQLSRVHSQMGSIFYSQLLYREHLIQFQMTLSFFTPGIYSRCRICSMGINVLSVSKIRHRNPLFILCLQAHILFRNPF